MVLNVVVLDQDERFVKFLNPDFIDITETCQSDKIRRIKFVYTMQSLSDARKLFKLGYKLWIAGDKNITDCLYVIASSVERDYFDDNTVTFEAEEVLVELNYAPLFSQTDLIIENKFTITTINDQENVTVDYDALNYWFGDYFNIGIVQDCLSNYVSRIVPASTMTKMELLRFIEEETSNIFVTRYEKDPVSNVIHRYLDFLNPNNNDKNWEMTIQHEFNDDLASTNISLYDPDGNLIDEGNIITETDTTDIEEAPDIDISSCYFKLSKPDGTELFKKKGTTLGLTSDVTELIAKIAYNNGQVTITLKDRTYSAEEWVDGQNATVSSSDSTISTTNINAANIPNHSVFEIYDDNKVWYRHSINPQVGDVHGEVLDLAYNVENIEYDIDESDTFTAISPVFNVSQQNKLTKQDLDAIIERWLSLSVTKGEIVPMVVEKTTMSNAPTDEFMAGVNVHNKYYSRSVKPNDGDNSYEYFKASSYWIAPFNKKAGEMHVTDEDLTGIEYNVINQRPDIFNERKKCSSLKMGTVSTSDEDVYAIYNDVSMKLKDKRYPKISVDVDVANLINHQYNNYNLHDIVFVKVPGFEKIITAEVTKTEKKAHDINKNKITLANYSINTKVSQKYTYVTGEDVYYTYPETSKLDVVLHDENDNPLSGKLLSFAVYYNQSTFSTAYTRVTNAQGAASLPVKLQPGTYSITVSFTGDVEYAASEQTFNIYAGGTVETTSESDGEGGTSTGTTYWTKCGVSPDGTQIMAIGKPSAVGEMKYGYVLWKSVFKRRCPLCGSKELYWGYMWKGNFPCTKRFKNGTAGRLEGHIYCDGCDADFSCIDGKNHVYSGKPVLSRISGPVRSSETEAYTLSGGQMVFEKKTNSVSSQTAVSRANPIGNVSATIKQKALSIAGNTTGLAAAKKIAAWCGPNLRYHGYNNFRRSPETVLRMGGGNCCDQTRTMFQLMDAAGVTSEYKLIYIHTVGGKGGHVFGKINGTYVDPCKANPWGHYVTGYGVPGSAPSSVYPRLPF